jgi:TolB-like protein/Tfp pilus assembly protein PilF
VPAEVEEVLLRALDPVPVDRYQTVEQFRAALAACPQTTGEGYTAISGSRSASRVANSRNSVPAYARRIALAATVVSVLALGALWRFGYLVRGSDGSTQTLAVLPLENASGDPQYAYLADGLTDALIDDLVRIPGVRVISGTSVMRYASASLAGVAMGAMPKPAMPATSSGGMNAMGPPKTVAEIGRELHADIILKGRLTRANDSIRVSATLIKASTQEKLWTKEYVRDSRQLFTLQQDLKNDIARQVAGGADGRNLNTRTAKEINPAANEAYLKGVYYQAHWKLPQAIASFERAVAIDSSDARAQAGLSRAYYFLAFFGDIPPGIAFGKMRRAASAALANDSLLAEAHAQIALVKMLQEWDWRGAEQEFRRAIELSPGDAQIHHDYAHFLLALGRQRESLDETAKAVELDPANPMLISCMGWHSLFDHKFDQAIRFAAEANALMPAEWASIVRGWALLGEGHPDSAVAAFAEGTRLSSGSFATAALANGLAMAGRTAESKQILDQLLAREQKEYVSPYDIATVYAGLGERDEAFRWLRRAADERSTFIVHLGWDSRFNKIRSDPRYRALIEQELKLGMPVRTVASARQ